MTVTTVRSRGLLLRIAAVAFWGISVSLLRYAYPVYFDGGGPTPSFFYWGHLPDLADYKRHQWQYDLGFLLPYFVASAALTLVCLFVAPKLSNRLTRHRSVGLHALASLLLIFALVAVSDVINTVWLKNGWVFYRGGLILYIRFLIVSLTLAVVSGLITIVIERWRRRVHD